ncbi:hypothetical protein [Frankia sp. Cr2]|uniref:hypothetical protein n=1 Tax=Frankia sp. Cr2 TaxID=3073932 RepID=UPI002AD37B7B|nr:hypothetical protein [Frankia sp. Cr2]
MTKRGDEIARPRPWTVRAVDRQAGAGWDVLIRQAPEAADRAWVALTSEPRRVDDRQHRLKGSLGDISVNGKAVEQWHNDVILVLLE